MQASSNAEQQRKQMQQEKLQKLLAQHVQSYPVDLLFPARVFANPSSNDDGDDDDGVGDGTKMSYDSPNNVGRLRTSKELIQHRLVESGLLFTDVRGQSSSSSSSSSSSNGGGPSQPQRAGGGGGTDKVEEAPQTLDEVTGLLGSFVEDLNSTGCYESVQVMLGRPSAAAPSTPPPSSTSKEDADNTEDRTHETPSARRVDVVLKEKKWYKLYIGGGIKGDTTAGTSSINTGSSSFPKVQFETSAGLINLTGHCDTTDLSYTVDQTSIPTLALAHTRPFYACFSSKSRARDYILNLGQGSKIGASLRGQIDTVDYENIRSSRDYIQRVGLRVANTTSGSSSGGGRPGEGVYTGIDWSLTHRDVMPRRSTHSPFFCDASPEVLAASGPSLKHSVVAEYKLNGYYLDDRFNPTIGVDSYGGVEVAGPPGDVGFVKCWGGGAFHWPLLQGLSFHSSFHCGLMKSLTYGGTLPDSGGTTNISDRFFVGGPHQLRGFVPAGIGPRAQVGGASTPGGDSIGGDAFYTATTALSIPFPVIRYLAQNNCRLFYFANAGTLAGLNSTLNVSSFMNSSRLSTGAGVSVGTPIGRVEITYSVPLRYGPRDARRSIQAGVGFNFG